MLLFYYFRRVHSQSRFGNERKNHVEMMCEDEVSMQAQPQTYHGKNIAIFSCVIQFIICTVYVTFLPTMETFRLFRSPIPVSFNLIRIYFRSGGSAREIFAQIFSLLVFFFLITTPDKSTRAFDVDERQTFPDYVLRGRRGIFSI